MLHSFRSVQQTRDMMPATVVTVYCRTPRTRSTRYQRLMTALRFNGALMSLSARQSAACFLSRFLPDFGAHARCLTTIAICPPTASGNYPNTISHLLSLTRKESSCGRVAYLFPGEGGGETREKENWRSLSISFSFPFYRFYPD